MKYKNIHKGKFIARPNRFIAHVEIAGKLEICHVKNTGRCKELLQDKVTVYCEKSDNPARKTLYDLIAVEKPLTSGKTPSTLLVNMDSQAPNAVVKEWLLAGNLFKNITFLKGEYKYGNSRFDFYVETKKDKVFIEVKGVTLENNGVLSFPDAPTERGIKHLNELVEATKNGYKAYVIFVVQMDAGKYFTPNDTTHPAFGDALRAAEKDGVKVLAYTCKVTPDTLEIAKPLKIKL